MEKLGREPGSNDPVFFDPDYDVPTALTEAKMERELVKGAQKAGLDINRVLRALGYEDEEEGLPKPQGIALEAPCPWGTISEFIASFPDPSPHIFVPENITEFLGPPQSKGRVLTASNVQSHFPLFCFHGFIFDPVVQDDKP